ncbi:MAG: tetratricopeptide repeat protein [Gemmatimonadales bacterium]
MPGTRHPALVEYIKFMATTLSERSKTSASSSKTPGKGGPTPAEAAGGLQAYLAWGKRNARLLSIIGGVIAIVVLGFWFVTTAQKRKELFANRSLGQARAIAETGNIAQASSEFQKIVDQYPGTGAAREAEISINQLRLITGQSELAIVRLRSFLQSNPGGRFVPEANALLGAALENSNKPDEAGAAYQAAAAASSLDYLKAQYLLEAGRAYATAGDTAKANAAYRQVIDGLSRTTAVTEAEVRLSEITQGKM